MRIPHNGTWVVATFNQPAVYDRDKQETWLLNPVRRYIFNANHLVNMENLVASISDLNNSANYRPLSVTLPLVGATVLIERYRNRGIGDLLFMTGPMAYLHHITGGQINIDMYGFGDRGQVLLHNPLLRYRTILVGPTHYDDLPLYNYHWFVNAVTEFDEEPDQLNVYDALYRQIGVDPTTVDARFKRPSMTVTQDELIGVNQFHYIAHAHRKLDLRRTGYYVVAPFTHSPTRTMPYSTWLEVIKELSKQRPVLVVGNLHQHVPDAGISAGEFAQAVEGIGANVINAINATTVRSLAALIAKANCVFGLDSGPLYMAQALRTPAVSVWGSHDPGVRLGYDPEYMELAVWTPERCRYAPCFTYSGFPAHKCPEGQNQKVCAVLEGVTAKDVMQRLELVENRVPKLSAFSPKQ